MSSSRPIYIPRNKRKRMLDHTVYSVGREDGWKPSSDGSLRQPLAAFDIMDERDFEEWGGATKLQQEFADSSQARSDAIADLFTVKLPTRIGDKLLAKLGWKRETGSTILPDDTQQLTSCHDGSDLQFLSQRRLRRIQLQQKRVEIPIPKLDNTGLGYDPHQNAPEFQAYKERMLKRQKSREPKHEYHIDSVLGREPTKQKRDGVDDDTTDNSAAYPHMALQDFVGTESAAGFALHDDDDEHVFDRDDIASKHISAKIKLNVDEYDMEAYEPEESGSDNDDEQQGKSNVNKPAELMSKFGDALSSWSGATSEANNAAQTLMATAVTADGKPPLPGFVLGGNDHTLQVNRFRGPDMPPDYQLRPHKFGPNENPRVWQALSHSTKLAAAEQRNDHVLAQARIVAPAKQINASAVPPTASVFGNLSKTMNDRFTAASTELETETSTQDETNEKETSAIQVKRTVQPFYPEPLLCKRFGVPVLPKLTVPVNVVNNRTREESFFHDHVLAHVDRSQAAVVKKPSTTRAIERIDEVEVDPLLLVERPEMEVFKSIFAADSDVESSTLSDNDNDDVTSKVENVMERSQSNENNAIVSSSQAGQDLVTYSHQALADSTFSNAHVDDDASTDLSAASSQNGGRKRTRKHRKKHVKHKKEKKKKKNKSY
ncbi:hypothetical protein MPSEU_000448000 [Mayamaea pseudoterrestris]|nr:hypothetical protein MPSEU_000448000 [Mayamaea pseudoterrestris]